MHLARSRPEPDGAAPETPTVSGALPAGSLPAGTLLAGRYRLEEPVGAGATGEVWRAVDGRLGRPVAVKVLRPALGADPDARRRFEMEAGAAARLNHPNIVAVYDTGEDHGRPFIVMECLPGASLADTVPPGGMTAAEVRELGRQVLAALAAAHAAGLLHRDIKAANILATVHGDWKVADFGIAKSLEAAVDLTATGLLIGTPAYLAPERLAGGAATVASDLFSVGVVLYEAATGQRPFRGSDALSTAAAVTAGRYPPPAVVRPDLPSDLAGAITRALSPDPADRPPGAHELAALLDGSGAPAPVAGARDATAVLLSPVPGAPGLPDTPSVGTGGPGSGPAAEAPEAATAVLAPTADGSPEVGPEPRPERRTRGALVPWARRYAAALVLALLLAVLVGVELATHSGSSPTRRAAVTHPAPVTQLAPVTTLATPTTLAPVGPPPPPAPGPGGHHHGHHPGG